MCRAGAALITCFWHVAVQAQPHSRYTAGLTCISCCIAQQLMVRHTYLRHCVGLREKNSVTAARLHGTHHSGKSCQLKMPGLLISNEMPPLDLNTQSYRLLVGPGHRRRVGSWQSSCSWPAIGGHAGCRRHRLAGTVWNSGLPSSHTHTAAVQPVVSCKCSRLQRPDLLAYLQPVAGRALLMVHSTAAWDMGLM